MQPAIIIHLQVVGNDEWDNAAGETFFEHHKPSYTSIAVLEWVNCFKALMQVYNIFERLEFLGIVLCKQSFHLAMNILRRTSLHSSDFVWQTLVFSYIKPFLTGIGGPGLEDAMELFDQRLGQFGFSLVNDEIDAAKVIGSLDDIIHIDTLIGNPEGVGLENISRLVMGQAAALYMI